MMQTMQNLRREGSKSSNMSLERLKSLNNCAENNERHSDAHGVAVISLSEAVAAKHSDPGQ